MRLRRLRTRGTVGVKPAPRIRSPLERMKLWYHGRASACFLSCTNREGSRLAGILYSVCSVLVESKRGEIPLTGSNYAAVLGGGQAHDRRGCQRECCRSGTRDA